MPAGAIHKQLMKLKAATAAQIKACRQRRAKASSNSARVNSQNTTTLPVDSAINGACESDIGGVTPIAEVAACAADPSAKAMASRPATVCLKSRNSDAAKTSNRAMAAARSAISMAANVIRRLNAVNRSRF